jgi:hypothetical protein
LGLLDVKMEIIEGIFGIYDSKLWRQEDKMVV